MWCGGRFRLPEFVDNRQMHEEIHGARRGHKSDSKIPVLRRAHNRRISPLEKGDARGL
jgi:hypothetical protein